jgi:hypothetical protein
MFYVHVIYDKNGKVRIKNAYEARNFRSRNMVRQAHQQVRQAYQPGSATAFEGLPTADRRQPLISQLPLLSLIRNVTVVKFVSIRGIRGQGNEKATNTRINNKKQ